MIARQVVTHQLGKLGKGNAWQGQEFSRLDGCSSPVSGGAELSWLVTMNVSQARESESDTHHSILPHSGVSLITDLWKHDSDDAILPSDTDRH